MTFQREYRGYHTPAAVAADERLDRAERQSLLQEWHTALKSDGSTEALVLANDVKSVMDSLDSDEEGATTGFAGGRQP